MRRLRRAVSGVPISGVTSARPFRHVFEDMGRESVPRGSGANTRFARFERAWRRRCRRKAKSLRYGKYSVAIRPVVVISTKYGSAIHTMRP